MSNFDLKKFLIENKLTSNSKLLSEDVDIKGIRKAVEGPEADAIFKKAQELLDDGDANGMVDALNIAADSYYELYNHEGNEDGIEVAKYIMNSTDLPRKSEPLPPMHPDGHGRRGKPDKSKWVVSKGTLSKDN